MRLIDADRLKDDLYCQLEHVSEVSILGQLVKVFESTIDKQPTINPEDLRPHGKWEENEDVYGRTWYKCSLCGDGYEDENDMIKDGQVKFCPNCGAKMDGE